MQKNCPQNCGKANKLVAEASFGQTSLERNRRVHRYCRLQLASVFKKHSRASNPLHASDPKEPEPFWALVSYLTLPCAAREEPQEYAAVSSAVGRKPCRQFALRGLTPSVLTRVCREQADRSTTTPTLRPAHTLWLGTN